MDMLTIAPAAPGRTGRPRVRRYDLVGAYLAVVLMTWAVWVPRAFGAPTGAVGQAWTWVPAVTVVVWAGVVHGRAGVRELWRRTLHWRVRWWWYPVVLVGPWLFTVAVTGANAVLGRPVSQPQPVVAATVVPLLVSLAVLVLTDGLGEEVAWRGYLLPRLLVRHGALTSSLILAAAWWVWHLPLLWTDGAPLEGAPWWLLLADWAALSIVFTCVFLHTGGSVLIAILLHAAINLFEVSPVPGPDGDVTSALLALSLKLALATGCLVHLALHRAQRRPSDAASRSVHF